MEDEFPPRAAVNRAWTIFWLLMPMWIQLTTDAAHWNATYIANGKRAKATLKN